jgi:AAA domain, putative AbiEii toxin, Type IV TA system
MPLVSYAVENYRGFVNETEIELRPLTLLFGYNSAGKSALMRILPLLADSCSMTPGAGGPLALHAPAMRGGTFQDLRSHRSNAPLIRFTLTWDAAPVRKVRFTVRDLPDRRRQIIEDVTIWDDLAETVPPCFEAQWLPQIGSSSEISILYNIRVDGLPAADDMPIAFEGLIPEVASADCPDRVAHLLGKLSRRLQRLPTTIHWLGPLRGLPPRSAEYKNRPRRIEHDGRGASDLLAYDRLDNGPLVQTVSAWYELVTHHRLEVESTVQAGSERFSIKLSPREGAPFPVHVVDTGEGMAQVLPVLVLGAMARHNQLPPGSVVAIEHPDLHLHPAAHEYLAAFLCDAVRAGNEQRLLVETHSENFLLRVQREIVDGRLPAERVLVYWVTQDATGRSVARRITFDDLGVPQGPWPPGVFSEDIDQARQLVRARRERHGA